MYSRAKADIVNKSGNGVILEGARAQACNKCKLKVGCGQYLLHSGESEYLYLPLRESNPDGTERDDNSLLEPGNSVEMALEQDRLMKLAMWFYGLPMLLVLVVAGLCWTLGLNEGLSIFFSAGGLVLGIFLPRHHLRDYQSAMYYLPRLIPEHVVSSDSALCEEQK